MKKSLLFSAICATVLTAATFVACNSNEEPAMDFNPNSVNVQSVTDTEEISAVYESAFDNIVGSRAAMSGLSNYGNLSTKYSEDVLSKSSWDLSRVTRISNVYQDEYCYIAANLKAENLMLCTISDRVNASTTSFTISQDGNLYTMYNSYGEPMIIVSYDQNNNILVVERLFNFVNDRVFWCKIGMAAVGGAISVVAIPATMGAGVMFSVCWSLATDLVCE